MDEELTDAQRQKLAAALAQQGIAVPGVSAPQTVTIPPVTISSPPVNPIEQRAAAQGVEVPGLVAAPAPVFPAAPPRPPPGATKPVILSASLPTQPDRTPLKSSVPIVSGLTNIPTEDLSGMHKPGEPPPALKGAIFANQGPPRTMGATGGGGGGGAVPPPSWQHLTSPEARAAYQEARSAEETADTKDMLTGVVNAELAEKMHKQHAGDIQDFGDKRAAEESAAQADTRAKMADYDSWNKQLMSAQVDPDHFWKDKSTGEKALLVISQALSDFGNSLLGHPELAGKRLNTLIDRDIEAQKANLDKTGRVVQGKANLVQMAYQRTGDLRQAAAWAKGVMLDKMDAEARAMAAETGSNTAMARGARLLADEKMRYADYLAKEMGLVKPAGGGSGAGGFKTEDNRIVPLGEGRFMVAGSREAAEYLEKRIAARDAIVGNLQAIQRLESSVSAFDRANPYSDYNAERDRLIADTETKKTVYEGQGAMSRDDAKVTDHAIGALRGARRYFVDSNAILDGAIAGINRTIDADLRAHGGPVVTAQLGSDAKGNVVQRYTPTGERLEPKGDVQTGQSAGRSYTITPAGGGVPPK